VVDQLRPATLLLGASALWALCLLVLSLAGLGSRFPAPEPAAAPVVPKVVLTRTESRLGPPDTYAEVGRRPLLNADRQPRIAPAEGGEATGELDVVLSSVLITPTLQMAIFTDNKDASSRRVRLGDPVPGSNWRLAVLEPRRAVLSGPEGERELMLRVFDGQGGQTPTAVANNDNAEGKVSGDAARAQPPLPPPPPPQSEAAQVVARPTPAKQPVPEQGATAPLTQEQQVEAIRRRIEARRAQMRAEAASNARQQ